LLKEVYIMNCKKTIVAACAVLCIGTALSVHAFAEEAKPIEKESAAQSVTVLSDGLKEGLKSGLKNGLKSDVKDGLKNGLKSGTKNGLKDGLKIGTKDGLKNGLKDGLKNGEKR